MKCVSIEKEVFRAYDIRGVVGSQLTEDSMYTLGLAIGLALRDLNRSEVFLARDGRLSSEAFAAALCAGLLQMGCAIYDLGQISTPMMYFATSTSETCDSGLMVTGSHNPSDYNGLKMVLAGKTLVYEDILRLYERVQAFQVHQPSQQATGSVQSVSIEAPYLKRLLEGMVLSRPLKVVVDCGNGVAGPIAIPALKALGCEVIPLYAEVDGRFPNHHPDPTVEKNLVDLRAMVKQHQADLGLGFDGDADRLGVVTNTGEVIWPDRLMMFYLQELLPRHPGASIVFDVKCSNALKQQITELGGVPIMCPTGHSIVKGVMKTHQAPLAGEMSGHLFFKDQWYGFDDALYSAYRLLVLLSRSPLSVSEQFQTIPNLCSTAELKIPILEAEKFAFIERFTKDAVFEDAERVTIDGLRVEFPKGWGLLRASNTTPCLVARFEAEDVDSLQEIQTRFREALLGMKAELMLPF